MRAVAKCEAVKRGELGLLPFMLFLKERKPAPLKVTAEQFRDIVKAVRGLSFSILDKCEVAQLRGLQKLLQEKNRLVTGIITYKEAKAGEKKEK